MAVRGAVVGRVPAALARAGARGAARADVAAAVEDLVAAPLEAVREGRVRRALGAPGDAPARPARGREALRPDRPGVVAALGRLDEREEGAVLAHALPVPALLARVVPGAAAETRGPFLALPLVLVDRAPLVGQAALPAAPGPVVRVAPLYESALGALRRAGVPAALAGRARAAPEKRPRAPHMPTPVAFHVRPLPLVRVRVVRPPGGPRLPAPRPAAPPVLPVVLRNYRIPFPIDIVDYIPCAYYSSPSSYAPPTTVFSHDEPERTRQLPSEFGCPNRNSFALHERYSTTICLVTSVYGYQLRQTEVRRAFVFGEFVFGVYDGANGRDRSVAVLRKFLRAHLDECAISATSERERVRVPSPSSAGSRAPVVGQSPPTQ
ncbi:hypothetical protein FIBSPDRAFT_884007 [Athelia psychrophila]|uniref:Uncharacterized protein n=1 Tax=Athelia psychrophila TaxID=1759441 RepID=A0A166TC63_9AGAM|nr:hypothetical protein FIBSPDRAFT_884007 [Fibularhizoctonia sp. CBS 109695]